MKDLKGMPADDAVIAADGFDATFYQSLYLSIFILSLIIVPSFFFNAPRHDKKD